MASKKITAMTDWAGGQVSTDLLTGVDLSAALADQNKKTTLNDLFSVVTKNITDGALRFDGFAAPTVSAAGQGSIYFDSAANVFKGSRNAGAYENLLFGSGTNKTVGVFTATADKVSGYTPFTYDSALERLYISDTVFSPTIEVSKTGTSPAYAKIFGGQGFASLGNWSATLAAPAYLNFYRGANGPALPLNTADIGSIRFRPAVDTSDTPTTVGGARIDVRATENAVAGVGGGVGLTIFTAANGQTTDTQRFLINYLGAVMVGVNSATITTNTGTDTKTVLGELSVYDADAIHQIGNPGAGDSKILIIQGNAAQTKALTEWQDNAGALLFSIGAAGSTTWAGTTSVAVSGAGQGQIYFDSGTNKFRASENGGAYTDLISAGGGGLTVGTTAIASGAAGRILYETSGNVLGEIAGSSADANGFVTFAPTARTSGVNSYFAITTPADTTMTASTESVGVYIGGNGSGSTVTRQWSTGALTTQREYVFVAPTYAFAGASTLSDAYTLFVDGAPATGTNATITRKWTMAIDAPSNVSSGAGAQAGGALSLGGNLSSTSTTTTLIQFGTRGASTSSIQLNYNIDSLSNRNLSWVGNSASDQIAYKWDTNGAGQGAGLEMYSSNYQIAGGIYQSAVRIKSTVASGKIGFVVHDGTNANLVVANGGTRIGAGSANAANSANAQLDVVSGSASRVGLRVDSAASPTVAIVTFTNNGNDRFTFNHDAIAYFGNGITNASPLAGTLSGTGGSGSNIAGASINIAGGKGTGTGNPGTVSIQFARPGTTGSTLNTLSDSLLFSYTTDAIYQTYKIKTTTTAETDAAAIGVAWLDNTHATRTSVFSIQTVGNASGLTIMAEFDFPTVAGDTCLAIYDVDNAAVERVSVGAADSGGTGYKVLRIPN